MAILFSYIEWEVQDWIELKCTVYGADRAWNLLWSFTLFITKFSIFLYSNNVYFNHMTAYKNINCIFDENLHIKSQLTEIEVLLQLALKNSLT